MLARSFKTAKELRISQRNYDALLAVLHMLERGEVQHVYPPATYGCAQLYKRELRNGFNMSCWGTTRCGTIHCIGGWAQALGGRFNNSTKDGYSGGALTRLFYPDIPWDSVYGYSYDKITVEQAAQALSNYLSTGDSKWPEVIGLTA